MAGAMQKMQAQISNTHDRSNVQVREQGIIRLAQKNRRKGEKMNWKKYRAAKGINASAIKEGKHSMMRMHASMTGGQKKRSPAMALGTLVHELLHSAQPPAERFAVWDNTKGSRSTEAYKTFAKSDSCAGKEIVTNSEIEEARIYAMQALSKKFTHTLIGDAEPEVSILWNDIAYGKAKAMLDYLGPDFAIEVKTMRDISDRAFANEFYGRGYHLQLGWYDRAVGKPGLTWWVLAIQTGEYPDSRMIKIPLDVINAGYFEAASIAAEYRACEARKEWPGVDRGEIYTDFIPPEWAVGERDLSIGGIMEASEL
jgi:hypothetical protein